jgi:cold shock protein
MRDSIWLASHRRLPERRIPIGSKTKEMRRAFLMARAAMMYIMLDIHAGSADVATGKVKWFNAEKGYGFIIPDEGGKDLFVHITAVQKAGYTNLVEGVRVSYDVHPDREGNPTAKNLRFA